MAKFANASAFSRTHSKLSLWHRVEGGADSDPHGSRLANGFQGHRYRQPATTLRRERSR